MPNFRRVFVPGATIFFTVVTDRRVRIFNEPLARSLLGEVWRESQARWPVEIDAVVLLPEHLHTLWTLPPEDCDYPKRWGWIKKEFTKRWLASGGMEQRLTEGRQRDRRRGVWQPKYWEHTIRDEQDLERHFDYIHYNPVKHGVVQATRDWPYSSFHRWVEEGVYSWDWGTGASTQMLGARFSFDDIATTVGE